MHHSDSVYTVGSTWQGSVWTLGQHQSAQHQAATSHQDQPLFRLITGVAFTSLAQPPAPLPHLLMTNEAWQATAEMSWPP